MLAALGLVGWGASLACDVAMWFVVGGYDPLAQTISELGAGPHRWLQDLGLVLFALGILCVAAGLHLRGGVGTRARLLQGALVLLAVDVTLVGLWNEYGNGVPGGLTIHRYLVWGLYALVPSILWPDASVVPVWGGRLTRFGRPAAVAWLVAAPIYKAVPPGLDGGYERLLALVPGGNVAAAAWRLYRAAEDDRGTPTR